MTPSVPSVSLVPSLSVTVMLNGSCARATSDMTSDGARDADSSSRVIVYVAPGMLVAPSVVTMRIEPVVGTRGTDKVVAGRSYARTSTDRGTVLATWP